MLVAIFEPSSLPTASSLSSNSKGKARAPPPEVIELSGSETEDEDGQPLSLSTKSTQPNGKGKEREAAVEVVEKRVPGWIYMGSHNFTPSAWGNLSMRKDGTPGQDVSRLSLFVAFLFSVPFPSNRPDAFLLLFVSLFQGANYELGIIIVRRPLSSLVRPSELTPFPLFFPFFPPSASHLRRPSSRSQQAYNLEEACEKIHRARSPLGSSSSFPLLLFKPRADVPFELGSVVFR